MVATALNRELADEDSRSLDRIYQLLGCLSEAHLHRYLAEFDFRHNTRAMSDAERGDELLRGAKGKRLMYHQPRETGHAQAES